MKQLTYDSLAKISAITMGYENEIYRVAQKTVKAQLKGLEQITEQKFTYCLHQSQLMMTISPGIRLSDELVVKVDLESAIDHYTRLAIKDPDGKNTKIFKLLMDLLNFIKIMDENYNLPIID